MTRLGGLLHFGQLFEACGNNYFAQIAHICMVSRFQNLSFLSKIIFGQLIKTFGDILLVTLNTRYLATLVTSLSDYVAQLISVESQKNIISTPVCDGTSVTRFGEIEQLLQNFRKTLAIIFVLFSIWQNFVPNLITFVERLGNFSLLLMAKY